MALLGLAANGDVIDISEYVLRVFDLQNTVL